MSRLIVKNLPSYLSDARLREHFAAQGGVVTDVRLMRKSDGTSRRFGFVGFKDETEARAAKEYFDRTFLDTSRISVEFAKAAKENAVTPANSDHGRAAKPTAQAKPTKVANKGSTVTFEEFMQVMAPRSKRKTWMNEDLASLDAASSSDPLALEKAREDKEARKRRKTDKAEKAAREEGDRLAREREEREKELDEEKRADLDDQGLTDLEYMRRRMRRKVGGEEQPEGTEESPQWVQSEDEQGESEDEEEETPEERKARLDEEERQRQEQEIVDAVMATGRLFLRNLPFTTSAEDLEKRFGEFGPIEQVHMPLDPNTKSSKGLAYVHYASPSSALSALKATDKTGFQGRILHVIPAIDKVSKPEGSGKNKTVADAKREARKKDAGKEFNWGMLYMNSDAVVSSIASRFNVAKADILNPEAPNAAVRLALAETHIIQETKDYLESQGINLSAFESDKKARSQTCILVKNIPFGTGEDEIRRMFAAHGDVARVLVPPAGTMAVVEMVVPQEAQTAFRALAYKRLGNSVLYLEKAPEGVFLPEAAAAAAAKKGAAATQHTSVGKSAPVNPVEEALKPSDGRAVEEEEGEPGSTLFVKNLSFATVEARFRSVCAAFSGFIFARIQTKPNPAKSKSNASSADAPDRLSMGYGFVGFKTAEEAKKARRALDGYVLDGHTLMAKFAKRGAEDEGEGASAKGEGKAGKGKPSTKMIIKNVPFEVTKKDIRELFSAHGNVKSVRLPKSFSSKTRGFAFVEFVSRREAENAMLALKHTHLLGRHLVLEWASEGADGTDEMGVEAAREKVRKGFLREGGGGARMGKRTKLVLDEEELETS